MTNSDVQTRVIELLRRTIEESSGREVDLAPDTELMASGYLDSLTVLQLFVALQEELGVELGVDDLTEQAFGTPKAIAELIEERM